MPIQDYNIYTGKGYAGDRFDSSPSVTQSGLVENVALSYGIAVKPGTKAADVGPQGIEPGPSVSGNVWGISMRELNHEAANRPSDGTATYVQGETASVMREGFLLVETLGVCTPNTLQWVNALGQITGDADSGSDTKSLNVTALEHGQPGDIVKVRIDIHHD